MPSPLKWAAVLLCALLLMATPVSAAAPLLSPAGFTDSQYSPHAGAIAVLKALDVLRGDAGTGFVRPHDLLSREEFVTLVVRAAGHELAASGQAGYRPPYTDSNRISNWAVGPVNYATGRGWLKGYEDGSFRPDGHLTMAEAITVLLRVTGHDLSVRTGLAWPAGELAAAAAGGLDTAVTVVAAAPVTREQMAQLTYNALFVPTKVRAAAGALADGPPLAEARARIVTGTVARAVPADRELRLTTNDGTVALALAGTVTLIGGEALTALNGLVVRTFAASDGRVFAIEVLGGGGAPSGTFRALTGAAPRYTGITLLNGTSFRVEPGVSVQVNGGGYTSLQTPFEVQAFLTTLGPGDEVQASVSGGQATHLDIVRLSPRDYIVLDAITRSAGEDDELVIYPADAPPGGEQAGTVVRVPKGTPVHAGGTPVEVRDLRRHDVVRLATRGSQPVMPHSVVIKLAATRDTLAGQITAIEARADSGGLYRAHVTVRQASGETRTVPWHMTSASGPAARAMAGQHGDAVVYLLNEDGYAVRNITPGGDASQVLVTGWATDGTTNWLTVDASGREDTYIVRAGLDLAAHLGQLGTLQLIGGQVTAFTPAPPLSAAGTVVMFIDPTTIMYDVGGAIGVISNPLVYAANTAFDGAEQYIGIGALRIGDEIKVTGHFVIRR